MIIRNEASSKKLSMYFVLKNRHRETSTLGITVCPRYNPQARCGNIMYENLEINGKMSCLGCCGSHQKLSITYYHPDLIKMLH